MVAVNAMRCENCGKLVEFPPDSMLVGWRKMQLPFSGRQVDVCSPGCAKREVSNDIDAEWDPKEGS